jgi:hypothetical protein
MNLGELIGSRHLRSKNRMMKYELKFDKNTTE